MINLITSTNLVGQTVILGENDIQNYSDIVQQIGQDEYVRDLRVVYNNRAIVGTIASFDDNGEIKFVIEFDRSVSLPPDICLKVEEHSEVEAEFLCMIEKVKPFLKSKIMLLDDDGCPAGFTTIGDILKLITFPDICDQLNIGEGNLVAGDNILTSSDGCSLKMVPASDISCE